MTRDPHIRARIETIAPAEQPLVDFGNVPEVFASGVEVVQIEDHYVLRWYRLKPAHEPSEPRQKVLVAEVILTAKTVAQCHRQLSIIEAVMRPPEIYFPPGIHRVDH